MVEKTAGDGMNRNHHDFTTSIGDIIICTSNYVVAPTSAALKDLIEPKSIKYYLKLNINADTCS